MGMFRAGMAVAFVFIGGIAAVLGTIVLYAALSTGTLSIAKTASAPIETIARASDPDRFYQMTALLGGLPLALGLAAAWWGWRTLRA